jgi:hypothetical protein
MYAGANMGHPDGVVVPGRICFFGRSCVPSGLEGGAVVSRRLLTGYKKKPLLDFALGTQFSEFLRTLYCVHYG